MSKTSKLSNHMNIVSEKFQILMIPVISPYIIKLIYPLLSIRHKLYMLRRVFDILSTTSLLLNNFVKEGWGELGEMVFFTFFLL